MIRLVVSAVSRHRRAIETSDGTAKSSDNSARSSFTDFSDLSEVLPADIAHYLQLAQDVSEDEQRAHSYEWQALVVENAPLRVNLNGHLVSAPEDFYDSSLKRQIQPGRPIVQIIGEMLMRYSLGLPDWWYRARLQHILSTRG